MTDITYYDAVNNEVLDLLAQRQLRDEGSKGHKYLKLTSVPFTHHPRHDNGVRHTATFTPDPDSVDDDNPSLFHGGTFTNTWEVYHSDVRGFLPNSIIPQNLPLGTYTDADMPFTVSPELLIASSANHFTNYIELLKRHLGSKVGLSRNNMDWWQARLRIAEERVKAQAANPNTDKNKEPLLRDFNAMNPDGQHTLETFTREIALDHAKSICTEAEGLHPLFLELWGHGGRIAGTIANAPTTTDAGNAFQDAVRWLFAHYTGDDDPLLLSVIGRIANDLSDDEFDYYDEVRVGANELAQIKCALNPESPMAMGNEEGYLYGIRHIDGSPITDEEIK